MIAGRADVLAAKGIPRAEVMTDLEHIYHLQHFWRPNGCHAWVTTVRVLGRRHPVRILGEHA